MQLDPPDGGLYLSVSIIALVSLPRERGLYTVYVPAIDAWEPTLLGGARVTPVSKVPAMVNHLRADALTAPAPKAE